MDLRLKGRVALVTGASRGIGLAVARELATAGADLFLVARDEARLAEVAAEIAVAAGVGVRSMAINLQDRDSVSRIQQALVEPYGGRVDILVNNAGASRPVGLNQLVEESNDGYWLNCLVHIALTRALLPPMQQQRWGRIINVAGLSARQPTEFNVTTMAKASLYAFAKSLSRAVARDGITVNTVSVGKIDTPQIRRKYASDEAQASLARTVPVGRLGKPEEVAAAVAFLASGPASYVTGSILTVDGGLASGVYG